MDLTPTNPSPFDAIRRTAPDGEWWSARDLAPLLGYSRWENFRNVIDKAIISCTRGHKDPRDHFRESSKIVALGHGGTREVEDWELSRYGCYLVIQNGDPSKEVIALGQRYFADSTQTLEALTAGAEPDPTAGMTDTQRRIYLRKQLTGHNKQLAATAQGAGVITPRDFAIFQDHGYHGLYNGEGAAEIAARKGLKPGEQILDHMGPAELAANLFRATQAEEVIRREQTQTKEDANRIHHDVGATVRATIIGLGNPPPEEMPTPPDSVQQAERRQRQLDAGQVDMFGDEK